MNKMAETTNLLARLIIQNTKGMDGEAFQMLRSDVSIFLTRLQAKVMVGPRTGCDEDAITCVFEICPNQETAVTNYIHHERNLGEIANVNVQFNPVNAVASWL